MDIKILNNLFLTIERGNTIHNDDEIHCLDKVVYQSNSWTKLSLINDPVIIGLQAQRFTYSQILCYVSAKFFNILNATKLGRTELQEYEPRGTTEILKLSVESLRNSSGIFSRIHIVAAL